MLKFVEIYSSSTFAQTLTFNSHRNTAKICKQSKTFVDRKQRLKFCSKRPGYIQEWQYPQSFLFFGVINFGRLYNAVLFYECHFLIRLPTLLVLFFLHTYNNLLFKIDICDASQMHRLTCPSYAWTSVFGLHSKMTQANLIASYILINAKLLKEGGSFFLLYKTNGTIFISSVLLFVAKAQSL